MTSTPISGSGWFLPGQAAASGPPHTNPVFRPAFGSEDSYCPRRVDLLGISDALHGWPHKPDVLAPNYMPSGSTASLMLDWISQKGNAFETLRESLARQKARVVNTHALLVNGTFSDMESLEQEANAFLQDVREEVTALDGLLQDKLRLPKQAVRFLHRFIAQTASILFAMGFPDAGRHAGQVARLCAIQAAKIGADPIEIMQAAMAGWLHDPKLPPHVCRENLATHPMIASALVREILFNPGFKTDLSSVLIQLSKSPSALNLLSRIHQWIKPDKYKVAAICRKKPDDAADLFIKGLAQALSINDDSPYIQELILKKLNSQGVTGKELMPAKHRLGWDSVKENHKTPPPVFSKETEEKLSKIYMETGLRGIPVPELTRIQKIATELADEYQPLMKLSPEKFYQGLVNGSPFEGLTLAQHYALFALCSAQLSGRFRRRPESFEHCTVKSLNLFSHHNEVTRAQKTAMALNISDPLLLAPHKVLLARSDEPFGKALASYLDSFSENIRYLPADSIENGLLWQKDVYLALLDAASQLTYQNNRARLPGSWEKQPLPQQIEELDKLLREETTWISESDDTNFAIMKLTDQDTLVEANSLVETVHEHYDKALDASPCIMNCELFLAGKTA